MTWTRAGWAPSLISPVCNEPKNAGGEGIEQGAHQERCEFEVLFRFYGPEKPLFDKTWKLGDIEEVK